MLLPASGRLCRVQVLLGLGGACPIGSDVQPATLPPAAPPVGGQAAPRLQEGTDDPCPPSASAALGGGSTSSPLPSPPPLAVLPGVDGLTQGVPVLVEHVEPADSQSRCSRLRRHRLALGWVAEPVSVKVRVARHVHAEPRPGLLTRCVRQAPHLRVARVQRVHSGDCRLAVAHSKYPPYGGVPRYKDGQQRLHE